MTDAPHSPAAPSDGEPIAQVAPVQATTEANNDGRIDTAQLLLMGRPDESEVAAARAEQVPVSYAGISAALGVVGLVGTLFVMWMVPFAIGAVIFADISRRNGFTQWPTKLGYLTGVTGIVFGGVWLIYTLGLFAS